MDYFKCPHTTRAPLESAVTSDLDQGRAVAHPWMFVFQQTARRRIQSRDQIQQVTDCIQELDVKHGERLWEEQQMND